MFFYRLCFHCVHDALSPPTYIKYIVASSVLKAFWPNDAVDVTYAPRTDSILYLSQLQIKKTSVLTHYVVMNFSYFIHFYAAPVDF